MKRAFGLHADRQDRRARSTARLMMGRDWFARRAAEVAALPERQWKGRTLRTIRCCGVSGRGPHDVHAPLALLWQLISLTDYLCPYHTGDAWRARP